jgi:hypothetical protein
MLACRFVASEQLRNLLGPEDVVLAKRTDPASLRAMFSNLQHQKPGGSNITSSGRGSGSGSRAGAVQNIAFPMAIQAGNCWKETLFWFGPRYTSNNNNNNERRAVPASSGGGNLCQASLVIPDERIVLVGVAVECVDAAFISNDEEVIHQKAAMVSNELAAVQRDSLRSVQGQTAETMQMMTFWSVTAEEFQKYGLSSCRTPDKEAEDHHCPPAPASFLVFLFKTTSSDLHLQTLTASLSVAAAKRSAHTLYWQASISLKVRTSFKRYMKPSLLQDVKLQIAQAETASHLDAQNYDKDGDCDGDGGGGVSQQLEEEDFESHEDVGLQVGVKSRVVLSCLVISCVVLCCVVLSCLVLSCLVLSCSILSCLVLSCLVLSCLVLSCFLHFNFFGHVCVSVCAGCAGDCHPSRSEK